MVTRRLVLLTATTAKHVDGADVWVTGKTPESKRDESILAHCDAHFKIYLFAVLSWWCTVCPTREEWFADTQRTQDTNINFIWVHCELLIIISPNKMQMNELCRNWPPVWMTWRRRWAMETKAVYCSRLQTSLLKLSIRTFYDSVLTDFTFGTRAVKQPLENCSFCCRGVFFIVKPLEVAWLWSKKASWRSCCDSLTC